MKVKFKPRYELNDVGVVMNPDIINIPIPKSIAKNHLSATIELAELNKGWVVNHHLSLPTCGGGGPVSYRLGQRLHPTAAEAAWHEADRMVYICWQSADVAHVNKIAKCVNRDRINSVKKCIENFMDDIELGIAELPGVKVLKQAELF